MINIKLQELREYILSILLDTGCITMDKALQVIPTHDFNELIFKDIHEFERVPIHSIYHPIGWIDEQEEPIP